jgi:hypothetical protein
LKPSFFTLRKIEAYGISSFGIQLKLHSVELPHRQYFKKEIIIYKTNMSVLKQIILVVKKLKPWKGCNYDDVDDNNNNNVSFMPGIAPNALKVSSHCFSKP